MTKTLYFLVISFIFFITFSFSNIFYLFGSEFILNIFGRSGYEGVKSSIVVIYGIIFSIYILIYLFKNKLSKDNFKILKIVSILLFLFSVSTLLSININASLLGIFEKYHSLLYFISLLAFFTSSYLYFDKKNFDKIIKFIIISSIFVYIYSFIQFLGFDPINNISLGNINNSRTTSFFGNANYLAGYILVLIPLYSFINNKYSRISLFIISFLALLTTGSYIGIFLGISYFIFYIFNKNIKILISILTIFILICISIFYFLPSDKKGSLIMRPYIWQTTILSIIDTPKKIFLGNGPETLQLVFNKYKPKNSILYNDKIYTADRSHNLFLDFIYFFGIIGGGLITYILFKSYFISKNNNIKYSILLFMIFFSLNIPVTIHYIIILLLIAFSWKNKHPSY